MKSKKEVIKDCAARLFRQKGYKATSMRDIARAVGMEAASLYNLIRSIQEILRELLMDIAHTYTKAKHHIESSSLAANEKIEKLIELHIKHTVERTDAISIITSEWVHLESPTIEEYLRLRKSYEEKFAKIIRQGIQAKQFEEVDIEIAVFSILSSLRWLYSWYSEKKDISPVELEQQMKHCLLNGLRKR